MTNIFENPRRMLGRAKHHIDDLAMQINSFVQDKPWSPLREVDVDGLTELHKIKFTRRMSEDIPHIVFDAANNLRPALDQMAFQIAVRHTGSAVPKHAKFPVGPTEADMLNNLAGGCKDLPSEIQTLFRGFKPYKGGNDALWALNELCNVPKHKTLIPVQLSGATLKFSGGRFRGVVRQTWEWDSEKNEIVYLKTTVGTNCTYNLDFTIGIAFNNIIQVIDRKPPVAVLNAMAGEVERVLLATEAECRRSPAADAKRTSLRSSMIHPWEKTGWENAM
jgi:hypothetical protein